jgi:serine/threonine protein phosphatase PrpC
MRSGRVLETATHAGLVRPENEDAVAARPLPGGGALLVVADGVGGAPGGALASRLAVEAVVAALGDGVPAGETPAAALRAAFAQASRRVGARRMGADARMSTTLVAALVAPAAAGSGGATACVANVGDSRAYVAGAASLRQVTRDHSWVEDEIRAGRLAPDDPLARSRRNLITRAVNGADPLAVDVFEDVALAPGDALLLCTDGLHGMVDAGAIAALLRAPAPGVAQRLIEAALAAGGADNVTVAVYAPAPGSPV